MSRVERNLMRKRMKRRRRGIFFSLFLVTVFLSLAIIATNNIMIQATGLSKDHLINMERLEKLIVNKTDNLIDRVQKIDISTLKKEIDQFLKESISLLKTFKTRWDSL